MTGRPLAAEYLSAIERGDLDAILALFGPGATVHSPLSGPLVSIWFRTAANRAALERETGSSWQPAG